MEISSLPSLSNLLNQNPNLQPNAKSDRFASNFENLQNPQINGTGSSNGVAPVQIDKTTPTDRVTAPGFAQMFEQFIKGVDQKKENFKTRNSRSDSRPIGQHPRSSGKVPRGWSRL